jgi:hypothetical protein
MNASNVFRLPHFDKAVATIEVEWASIVPRRLTGRGTREIECDMANAASASAGLAWFRARSA